MKRLFTSALGDSKGATAIEYGLIAALLAVSCIGAFKVLAGGETSLYNVVATKSDDAISNAIANN